jgi:hypothetical protein
VEKERDYSLGSERSANEFRVNCGRPPAVGAASVAAGVVEAVAVGTFSGQRVAISGKIQEFLIFAEGSFIPLSKQRLIGSGKGHV